MATSSYVPCNDVMEGKKVKVGGFTRRILGSNSCDSKWVIYGLCCIECNLWYAGKTFNEFKSRYNTHKSKIKAAIRDTFSGAQSCDNEGVYYLLKHFVEKHPQMFEIDPTSPSLSVDLSNNLASRSNTRKRKNWPLKWTIFHHIGKTNHDPAGNLLKWERAYIEGLDTQWPKGLNTI